MFRTKNLIIINEGPDVKKIDAYSWPYDLMKKLHESEIFGWIIIPQTESMTDGINRITIRPENVDESTATKPKRLIAIIQEVCEQFSLKIPVNIEMRRTEFETTIIFDPSLVQINYIISDITKNAQSLKRFASIDLSDCEIGIVKIKINPIYGKPKDINQAEIAIFKSLKDCQRFPDEIN